MIYQRLNINQSIIISQLASNIYNMIHDNDTTEDDANDLETYARDKYSTRENIERQYVSCVYKLSDVKSHTFDITVNSPDEYKNDTIILDRSRDTVKQTYVNIQSTCDSICNILNTKCIKM